jgi:hypothetical protein
LRFGCSGDVSVNLRWGSADAARRGDQLRQVSAAEYRNHLVTTFGDMKLNSNPTDGAALRDLAREIRDASVKLDDVVPPPDAARAQGRLVAGLEEYADQLDSLAVQFQQQRTDKRPPAVGGSRPSTSWPRRATRLNAPLSRHASFGEEPALGLEPRTSSLQMKRSAS